MGDTAGQFADGVHLLALEDRLARLLQCLGRLAPFGEVAGDLGKAQQFAGRIADRIDHDAGPETGAILADAPALRLEPAFALGGVERTGGEAGHAVFLRIEAGEILTHNLFGAVALEPFGTAVPAGDRADRVDHVDGIVSDALHQQAEAFLAAAQFLLRGAAFGEVAGHLGKAEQMAGGVADRIDHHIGPEPGAILAQAPAFRLEPPFDLGGAQYGGGHMGGAVLLSVESREMLADNLVGAVPLDALRPAIPADDEAGRIEHEDRIVGDALDQQFKPVDRLACLCRPHFRP